MGWELYPMDNIFLEEFQSIELTKNQKKIAQYCMDHQYQVCQETLSELAAHVGVTEVTILNFVRKLGYTGFAEFKSNAHARIMEQVSLKQSSLSTRMRENGTAHQRNSSIEVYMETATEAVKSTLMKNKMETYQQAADRIFSARHVLVIGARSCSTEAEHFVRMLSHISNSPRLISDRDISYTFLQISGAAPGDVLLLFCKKRYYKMDIALCKLAKEIGVQLILITDSILAPMVPYADLVLLVTASGISFFDSSVGFAVIREYLLQLIAERAGKQGESRWELVDRYTGDYRF